MWTCPVCDQLNEKNFCSYCGFERSTNYTQYPTLNISIPPTTSISHKRRVYQSQNRSKVCTCCGGIVIGTHCTYCNFSTESGATATTPKMELTRAAAHAESIIASLTDFSIVSYRYGWEPKRSRLEYQSEEILSLGDAQDFFQNIVWCNRGFAQLRNGTGTELKLTLTYYFKGKKKQIACTLPTVKCDSFWLFGISLDPSLHLKLHLGSGKKFIETAPIALELT